MQTLQASCEDPRRFFYIISNYICQFFFPYNIKWIAPQRWFEQIINTGFHVGVFDSQIHLANMTDLVTILLLCTTLFRFYKQSILFFSGKKVHETLERPSHRECLAKVLDWMLSNNYTFHSHLIFAHQLGGSSVKTIASLEALPFSPSSRVLDGLCLLVHCRLYQRIYVDSFFFFVLTF